MHYKIEKIPPEKARTMLKKNKTNRPLHSGPNSARPCSLRLSLRSMRNGQSNDSSIHRESRWGGNNIP